MYLAIIGKKETLYFGVFCLEFIQLVIVIKIFKVKKCDNVLCNMLKVFNNTSWTRIGHLSFVRMHSQVTF